MLIVGFFLATALVTTHSIVYRLSATEVSNWSTTAVNAGAALAARGVGVVVDTFEPRWGFAAGALVALAILTCGGIAGFLSVA